jgi:hypothetical protein
MRYQESLIAGVLGILSLTINHKHLYSLAPIQEEENMSTLRNIICNAVTGYTEIDINDMDNVSLLDAISDAVDHLEISVEHDFLHSRCKMLNITLSLGDRAISKTQCVLPSPRT